MRTFKAAFWMPNLCSSFSSFSFSLQGSHGLILSIPLFLNCIHTASFLGGALALLVRSTNFYFPFLPEPSQSGLCLSLSIQHNTHRPSDALVLDHIPLSRTKQNTSKMLYSARIWDGVFFIYDLGCWIFCSCLLVSLVAFEREGKGPIKPTAFPCGCFSLGPIWPLSRLRVFYCISSTLDEHRIPGFLGASASRAEKLSLTLVCLRLVGINWMFEVTLKTLSLGRSD